MQGQFDQIKEALVGLSGVGVDIVLHVPTKTPPSSDEQYQLLESMLYNFQATDTKPTQEEFTTMLNIVKSLRSSANTMSDKVDKLEAQIASFIGKVNSLETANSTLTERITKLEGDAAYLRYQLALQDLNARYMLEVNMRNHFSKMNLKRLRSGRNTTAHLYDEADDEAVKGYKTHKAIEMMKAMDATTAEKFSKNFGPRFIEAVVKHFETVDLTIKTTDPDEIKLAEEWWTI